MKTRSFLASVACIALIVATSAFGSEAANSGPSLYSVHFVEVDVGVLAENVALATGKTFIVDRRVKALLTLETEKPVSAEELYKAFVRVLSEHGLRVTERRSGAILIAPVAAPPPAPRAEASGVITI